MTVFLRAFALLHLLLVVHAGGARGDVADVAKAAKPSVVTLVSLAEGKELGQGSGFLLTLRTKDGKDQVVVISNVHVIAGATQVRAKFTDGTELPIEGIAATNFDADVLALAVGSVKAKPLALASTQPEAGERLIALGTPLGLEFTVTDGILSATRRSGNVIWLQHSAPISPGSSGGPLLNQKGEVVGVNTFKRVGGENLNFACSFEMVKGLELGKTEKLESWAKTNKKSDPNFPVEVKTPPDEEFRQARIDYKMKHKQAVDAAIAKLTDDQFKILAQMKSIRLKPAGYTERGRTKTQILSGLQAEQIELSARIDSIRKNPGDIKPYLNPLTMSVGDVGHLSSITLVGVVNKTTVLRRKLHNGSENHDIQR